MYKHAIENLNLIAEILGETFKTKLICMLRKKHNCQSKAPFCLKFSLQQVHRSFFLNYFLNKSPKLIMITLTCTV